MKRFYTETLDIGNDWWVTKIHSILQIQMEFLTCLGMQIRSVSSDRLSEIILHILEGTAFLSSSVLIWARSFTERDKDKWLGLKFSSCCNFDSAGL